MVKIQISQEDMARIKAAVREVHVEERKQDRKRESNKAFYRMKKIMESYADLKRFLETETEQAAEPDKIQTAILVHRVEKAMDELAAEYKSKGIGYQFEAFRLHYVCGKPYEDIAEELGSGKNSPAMWSKKVIRRMAVKILGANGI